MFFIFRRNLFIIFPVLETKNKKNSSGQRMAMQRIVYMQSIGSFE